MPYISYRSFEMARINSLIFVSKVSLSDILQSLSVSVVLGSYCSKITSVRGEFRKNAECLDRIGISLS